MYILSIHFLISGYESCHNICVKEWKKVSTVKSTGATSGGWPSVSVDATTTVSGLAFNKVRYIPMEKRNCAF
jgi:hypothetical protein